MTEFRIKQLSKYIVDNLNKGYTLDSLRWALLNQGYTRTEVEKSIEIANKNLARSIPKIIEKPKITYSVLDENYEPVKIKKSWWRKFFGT